MYGGAAYGNEVYSDFYSPIIVPVPPYPLPPLPPMGAYSGIIYGNEVYSAFYLPVITPPSPPSIGGFGGGGFDWDYIYYDYDTVSKKDWILVPRIELEKYRKITKPKVNVFLVGEFSEIRVAIIEDTKNDKNKSN